MYTGDDFNYPDLIAGDDKGFSHALLGIFDRHRARRICGARRSGQAATTTITTR